MSSLGNYGSGNYGPGNYDLGNYGSRGNRLIITLFPEEESILINGDVLEAIGRPRQIQLMINDEKKKLLLMACEVEDRQAVVVPEPDTPQFEISGQSLIKRIRKLTGWTDHNPRAIEGIEMRAYHAVIFDLLDAYPFTMNMI